MSSNMSRKMIAQILWAIFGDARQFFSKCATTKDFDDSNNLPQSHTSRQYILSWHRK
jgi:hypothetical protein